MTENEIAFRNLNGKLSRSIKELLKLAKEDHQEALVELPTGFLLFRCECADNKCDRRIKMSLKTWDKQHENPNRFCVSPGHVVGKIEKPVEHRRHYEVIEKLDYPKQESSHIWRVPIHFD